MTITEKAAYLKGLVEGKGLDPEAGEGKLWHVLSELVGDMAAEITALREAQDTLSDNLEEVEVGLDYLEEFLQEDFADYNDDDEEDDAYYPFSGSPHVFEDDEDEDDSGEALQYAPEEADGFFYEVECPNCGAEINFDDEILEAGAIQCPSCGATLEFDIVGSVDEEPDVQDAEPESENDDD